MTANKSNAEMTVFNRKLARPFDLDAVLRIVQTTVKEIYPLYYPAGVVQYFLDYHAADGILTDIKAGRVHIFEVNTAIVGTGTIRENEIVRVFVLPECQGKGYGSLIMKQLEDIIFRNHRIARLDSSLPAFGMYLKLGYKFRAWRQFVTPGGQVLCYPEMEKENSGE